MKKIYFLVLLFLILFPSKASAQMLFKSGEYLYIENAPFNLNDKISIEGVQKLKQFKTNSCGIGLTELNADVSDVEILDLASSQKQSFSVMEEMDNFNKIPICNNGVLEVALYREVFSINDNVHETIFGFKLNPNTSYAFVYDSSISKKLTPNSCQFVKIKKPDNIISDSALKISYLIYNFSTFVLEPIEEKTWENLPEKKPPVCLRNIKYIPR
ncbi:hypothetical protein [Nostoc sp. 'Lobaria pulmonaria (5183) cyanobiont']|uniref:hypothetical protein n=1 Tax=Nostoc sp. 'Lobaria pulmonaria (5183) cyanobiont' TaxID=1618022 RepID=UPI000CF34EB3|nr:hypothetical protein [Nostoc sp. 'Lobaria pulmonaria (5183) cyanobiont']AVH74455.1 hypothetical protein NLP_30063 [Nostoc sp. 'Lobaria pulmonaria (5183) cyanobiont']